MKRYIKPETTIIDIRVQMMMAVSKYDVYNSEDVSYSKDQGDLDEWDDWDECE